MYSARRRLAIWVLCAGGFALALVVVSQQVELVHLTRDPASLGGLQPWWGSLSIAAVGLWVCAATACLFGASALWRLGQGRAEATRFLLATGLLATAAAADDALQIHEHLVPVELGLPEGTVLVVWLIVTTGWAARFHASIMRSDVLMLGLTALMFAASLAFDAFDVGDTVTPYEDYCKLTGIATLAWYSWHEALTHVTRRPAPLTDG